jgi:hypothetical protein
VSDFRIGQGRGFQRRAVLGGLGALGLGVGPVAAQSGPDRRGIAPVGAGTPAGRTSPPQAPVLMPGTAMHVGPIRAVAVSTDGTLIATGSADRSIRLWNAATGESLLRLHLPLGDGAIGVVDAIAISPDNRRLFVSGLDWASPPGGSRGMAYVFELSTGRMTGLMAWPAGFGSRLRTLAIAPSGAQIAIAAGNNGLIVRDTEPNGFALRFSELPNPSVAISAVGYSPDGKLLATAAGNGRLRLMEVDAGGGVREASSRLLPGGGQPNSLAFSADGQRLAIGYVDRPQVLVAPVRPGAAPVVLSAPAGSSSGNLAAVAWGRGEDGHAWLFAGGTVVDGAGRNLMLGWRDGRPGAPAALPVAWDSITQVVAHPAAGVVFGSSDPRWGWATPGADNRSLRLVQAQDTERVDLRGVAARVWGIDATGGVVEFQGAGQGATVLRFNLAELTLTRAAAPRTDLSRPRPVAAGGQAPAGLDLPRGAVVRSADRAAEAGRMLYGADDYLVLANAAGHEEARRDIATAAWGVAIARGRPVAVAAHGDGTVRWYALDSERMLTELGGLFVAADEERWIIWRADGRFAHSPGGGAKLVGFLQNGRFEPGQVSEGGLTGRWMDIDQLYRRLYDPDQVRLMLDPGAVAAPAAGGEIQTLRLPSINVRSVCAAEERPAETRGIRVVEALKGAAADDAAAPASGAADAGVCRMIDAAALQRGEPIVLPPGTTAMRVELSLDASDTPTQVAAFVNEQNVGRSLVRPDATRGIRAIVPVEQHVPLFAGENRVEFRAYVEGRQDFTRSPTVLRVRVDPGGPAAVTAPAVAARPVLRALVVGIDDYRGTIHRLKFARADAGSFADAIGRRTARDYAEPVVMTLFDQAATADAITAKLAEIATVARPADAVVIYFAGHGVVGADDRAYSFLTADVSDADAALRGGQGMGAERLARGLAEIRAERIFLFLDTCYAGAFDPRTIGYLNHDTGRYVLAASTRLEEALDGFDGVNGLFAHAVKEGLDGRAGGGGGGGGGPPPPGGRSMRSMWGAM